MLGMVCLVAIVSMLTQILACGVVIIGKKKLVYSACFKWVLKTTEVEFLMSLLVNL